MLEALRSDTTPDEMEGLELVCGSVSETGSMVVRELRVKKFMEAVVVRPAVTNAEEQTLLDGRDSIAHPGNIEQIVLDWLSN